MGFPVADKSDLELVGVPTQAASAAPRAPKILNSARPAPPRTVVTRPAVRRVHAHVFVGGTTTATGTTTTEPPSCLDGHGQD
jgi:hypothetical protein